MKKLTQGVFSLPDCPPWVKSAAVNYNGKAYYCSVYKKDYHGVHEKWGHQLKPWHRWLCFGEGYDTTDWQHSAIDRE